MNNKIPSENDIEELIKSIQPNPGSGFNLKMAKKPWNLTKRVPYWTSSIRIKTTITLGIILMLVLGFSFLFPSLNTLARRFTVFFSPSPISVADRAVTALETNYPHERFNLTIAEAENLFGFEIKIPDRIPADYKFEGTAYDELREAVIFSYTTNSGGLVLRISKQKIDADYQAIGPEAIIEFVSIGPYAGEFVSGGWMIPEVKSDVDANNNPYTPQAIWDPNVKLQTLRWTDGEFLFEIILAGGSDQIGYLDKHDLIALANHIH